MPHSTNHRYYTAKEWILTNVRFRAPRKRVFSPVLKNMSNKISVCQNSVKFQVIQARDVLMFIHTTLYDHKWRKRKQLVVTIYDEAHFSSSNILKNFSCDSQVRSNREKNDWKESLYLSSISYYDIRIYSSEKIIDEENDLNSLCLGHKIKENVIG